MGNNTSTARSRAEVIYVNQAGETKSFTTGMHYSGKGHGQKESCRGLNNRYANRPYQDKHERTTAHINQYCAEVQVIHELHPFLQQITGNNAHDILVRVFTTWTPCAACEHDIQTLHSIFPKAEVVIRSGSQYVAQSQSKKPPEGIPYKNAKPRKILKQPRLQSTQPQTTQSQVSTQTTQTPVPQTVSSNQTQSSTSHVTPQILPPTGGQMGGPSPMYGSYNQPYGSYNQPYGGYYPSQVSYYPTPMFVPNHQPNPYMPNYSPYTPMPMYPTYSNPYPMQYPTQTGNIPSNIGVPQSGQNQLPTGAVADLSGEGYMLNGRWYPYQQ